MGGGRYGTIEIAKKLNEVIDWINEHEKTGGHIDFITRDFGAHMKFEDDGGE